MSEFCRQCARGHGEPPDFGEDDVGDIVLCEGCGWIRVDTLGQCTTHDHGPTLVPDLT